MKRFAFEGVLALALLSSSSLLMGCDNDPSKGKEKAVVSAPVETAPPAEEAPAPPPAPAASAAAPAAGVSLAFAPADSSIEFTGAKVTGKHDIKVKEFTGTVSLVEGDPTKSTVKVEMTMASLDSTPAKFLKHLKSPDLLDVEKFPKATFESTSIVAGGANGATHTVTGNLTLHGEKKSVSFPATIVTAADRVTVKAEFAIDRKDFGVTYPGMPDDLIKDQVLVKLNIDAKKS